MCHCILFLFVFGSVVLLYVIFIIHKYLLVYRALPKAQTQNEMFKMLQRLSAIHEHANFQLDCLFHAFEDNT